MSLRSAGDSAFVREGKTRFIRKIAVKRKENMSTDGMCCDKKKIQEDCLGSWETSASFYTGFCVCERGEESLGAWDVMNPANTFSFTKI